MLGFPTKSARRFFDSGWGTPDRLSQLKSFEFPKSSATISDVKLTPVPAKLGFVFDGECASPFPHEYLPEESHTCYFRLFSPVKEFTKVPVCIFFSMTGDQGYEYRYKAYVKYLLSKNIASLLIENPYYGKRKPEYQSSVFFASVTDMLAMALAAVEEGRGLATWLKEIGCEKVGVAGVSQAAMMAGGVGALLDFPVAVVCSLVAHSPEVILCDGLLKKFVNWGAIEMGDFQETQYHLIETFRGTDLTRLPRPKYPKATILQGAYHDLVAPRYSVKMVHRLWPGSDLRWLPGTHLTSLALHKKSVCHLVRQAFDQLH